MVISLARLTEMVEIPATEQKTGKKRRPKAYIGRCMFCGFCEEKCPTGAFHLTEEYELAATVKAGFVLTPEMLDGYVPEHRKGIELVYPDDHPVLDMDKCISCKLCAKNCPADAIGMVAIPGTEKVKADGSKGRAKEIPIFDYSLCMWCGLCEECCKPEAINFVPSKEAKSKNEGHRRVTEGGGGE